MGWIAYEVYEDGRHLELSGNTRLRDAIATCYERSGAPLTVHQISAAADYVTCHCPRHQLVTEKEGVRYFIDPVWPSGTRSAVDGTRPAA